MQKKYDINVKIQDKQKEKNLEYQIIIDKENSNKIGFEFFLKQ